MCYEAGQRRMCCWLPANELDLLDSSNRGFRQRLHPLIYRDGAVTFAWSAPGVAVAALELAITSYFKPHEMRVTQRMAGTCDNGLHVAPFRSDSVCATAQSILERLRYALR